MTSHPYLDLQQGNVENYCMMVPKAEVPQWYGQGWLPHYSVGLSRREANRTYMVYGFMRFKRLDRALQALGSGAYEHTCFMGRLPTNIGRYDKGFSEKREGRPYRCHR